jgi:hypothetical protein
MCKLFAVSGAASRIREMYIAPGDFSDERGITTAIVFSKNRLSGIYYTVLDYIFEFRIMDIGYF